MKLEHTTRLKLTDKEQILLEEVIHMLGEMDSEDDIKDFVNSWLICGIDLDTLITNLIIISDMVEDED